ncbi:MAG TPA: RHS repeat-associated core domain-containing protein, partial [Bacteroidia bacterium]
GSKDQYFHRFIYDKDNRISEVYTSKDEIWWDKDASYTFYNHGAIARTVIGDLKVQGIDYAYTIHGWLKGINSSTMQSDRDIGKDGLFGGPRQFTAKDVFGYSLGYYNGDYQDIKGNSISQKFESQVLGSDLINSRQDLWNGNISYLITASPNVSNYNSTRSIFADIKGVSYNYDQLNRLLEARSFFNINTATNTWQFSGSTPSAYLENFTYDKLGNISHVNRWGNSAQMDNIDYRYNTQIGTGNLISNKLYHVDDAITGGAYIDDIDDQGTFNNAQDATINTLNNYAYDELGNLKRDNSEQIASIEWTMTGKVKKVIRTIGSAKPDLEFKYDANGRRIIKIVKNKPLNVANEKHYYYVYDADGLEMANYEITKTASGSVDKLYLASRVIHGASRLGVDNRKELLYDNGTNLSSVNITNTDRKLSFKAYELSNYLNNVLVVVSDKKIPRSIGGVTVDYFEPELINICDYYSFGGIIKSRSWSDPNFKYKYSFNGKEKDDEFNVVSGSYDFGARIYDSRLGRWLSMDPMSDDFVDESPYLFSYNNPIMFMDNDGEMGVPGFFKGLLFEYAGQVCSNLITKRDKGLRACFFDEIDWADVGISGLQGIYDPKAGCKRWVKIGTQLAKGALEYGKAAIDAKGSGEYKNYFKGTKDFSEVNKAFVVAVTVNKIGGSITKKVSASKVSKNADVQYWSSMTKLATNKLNKAIANKFSKSNITGKAINALVCHTKQVKAVAKIVNKVTAVGSIATNTTQNLVNDAVNPEKKTSTNSGSSSSSSSTSSTTSTNSTTATSTSSSPATTTSNTTRPVLYLPEPAGNGCYYINPQRTEMYDPNTRTTFKKEGGAWKFDKNNVRIDVKKMRVCNS